jgi:hypothetical protein
MAESSVHSKATVGRSHSGSALNERQEELQADVPRLERLLELGVCTRLPAARQEAFERLRRWINGSANQDAAVIAACAVIFRQMQRCLRCELTPNSKRRRTCHSGAFTSDPDSRTLVHLLTFLARIVGLYARRQGTPTSDALSAASTVESRPALLRWLAARLFHLIDAIIVSGVERTALASLPGPLAFAKAARDRVIALVCRWRDLFADVDESFQQAYLYTFEILRVPQLQCTEAILRPRFFRNQQELEASLRVQIPALIERLTREHLHYNDENFLGTLEREFGMRTSGYLGIDDASDPGAMQRLVPNQQLSANQELLKLWSRHRDRLRDTLKWVKSARTDLEQRQQLWTGLATPHITADEVSVHTSLRGLDARLSAFETRLQLLWSQAETLGIEHPAATSADDNPTENRVPSGYAFDDHMAISEQELDANNDFADIDFIAIQETFTGTETSENALTFSPIHSEGARENTITDSTEVYDERLPQDAPSLPTDAYATSTASNQHALQHAVDFTLPEQINQRGFSEIERLLQRRISSNSENVNEEVLQAFEAAELHLLRAQTTSDATTTVAVAADPLEGFLPADLRPNRRRSTVSSKVSAQARTALRASRHRLETHLRRVLPRAQRQRMQQAESIFEHRQRDRRA